MRKLTALALMLMLVLGVAAGTAMEKTYTFGYIYLPAFFGVVLMSILMAPVGARLAHKLPVKKLKRAFGGFLALLAMGVEEFSMRPAAVEPIKAILPKVRRGDLIAQIDTLLQQGTVAQTLKSLIA